MGKTVLYLLILAILGFGVYYFLFSNRESTVNIAEAGFTIKDTAAIGKVFLASNEGESITVERTDSGWMVNKRYKALPSTLNLLLGTMKQQSALYPVTKNAYENAVKNLSTYGIKVEVYGRDLKKMRVFYVGGAAVNNTGTNMMMEGASTPYVVTIQGFNGYLTPHYSTNIRDWRDRTVFNIPQDQIKSVSLDYAGKSEKSFVITRENGNLAFKSKARNTAGSPNMNRVNAYLKFFTNINCEGFLNGLSDMDTTLKTAPKQSTLVVEDIHGKTQHADIYWVAINRRSKNITVSNPDVPDDYDADRLYAVINNNRDTVMIQQFAFRNIFRKAADFYGSDTPQGSIQK
jgi:hypothetical protein